MQYQRLSKYPTKMIFINVNRYNCNDGLAALVLYCMHVIEFCGAISLIKNNINNRQALLFLSFPGCWKRINPNSINNSLRHRQRRLKRESNGCLYVTKITVI